MAALVQNAIIDKERSVRNWRIKLHASIFITLILLWEIGSRLGWLDPLFYPRPTNIMRSFWLIYVQNANVWYHLYATMSLVFMGWVGGSILGVSLGALVGFNSLLRRFLKPYVIVLEATPRIAVAPLLIAALGFGASSKIAIIILVCFFAPFINTLSGVINVNEERLELFRSMRASKMQVLRKLVLPDAIPIIMAGERLALTAALSGALVAEFIQRDEGIGSLILVYTRNLNMASAFSCIFTLTILGFLIFKGMEKIDHYIAFWKYESGRERVSAKRRNATDQVGGFL